MTKNLTNKNQNINVFVDNFPEWGGTYQYTQILINSLRLKLKKKNIKIFYTKKKWKNNLKNFSSEFVDIGKFEKFFLISSILLKLGFLIPLLSKLKLINLPSVFFLKNETWLFPSQDILSSLCRGQSIVSIHDLMHRYTHYPEVSSFLRKIYRDQLFENIVKNAKKILVDSKLGKKQLYECYGRIHKVYVQYFVVNTLKIDKQKKIPNSLYYPAQYWPHKNHYNLILSIKILKKRIPDIKLFLSGHELHEFKKLKNLVRQQNLTSNVIFLGYVTERLKVMKIKQVTALINPSFLGPTNIPQLEAFNYSCPVLVSNIFAAKEQCKNAAVYFNPHSSKSIANAVCNLFNNKKLINDIIKKGKILKKKYSLTNFSNNLFKVIVD